jgi:hypothetical protein
MEAKPGWKTSEAWLTGIVAWLMQDVLGTTESPIVQAAACVSVGLVAIGYIWSRQRAKETGE